MSNGRPCSPVASAGVCGVVVVLLIAAIAVATASAETDRGQQGQAPVERGQILVEPGSPGGGQSVAADRGASGALRFTAVDLALMLGGGLVLAIVGAGVARLSPRAS